MAGLADDFHGVSSVLTLRGMVWPPNPGAIAAGFLLIALSPVWFLHL